MKERLDNILRLVRRILFSKLSRRVLQFLLFLGLSATFWLLMTLNETREQELGVPVKLTNVPRNAVITTPLPDTLRITLRDKGFVLASYVYGSRMKPLTVDFAAVANKQTGHGSISQTEIQRQIRTWLHGSTKIAGIKTDRMEFFFNYGLSKRVPVRLEGNVTAKQGYYLARKAFVPEFVTIYARRSLLDSIKYVTTRHLNITNVADTLKRTVELQTQRGVKVVPTKVKLLLFPDILTEESIEVPITTSGAPNGTIVRFFPSHVTVKFTVGASMYRDIKAKDFLVVADYEQIAAQQATAEKGKGNAQKCSLHLQTSPGSVMNARIETTQADYLVEQQ